MKRNVEIETIASALAKGNDGIWYVGHRGPISYPAEGHQSCFGVEERSFWFAHRNRCILALLRQFPPRDGGPFLDVGGGNGFVSLAIEQAGLPVVLVEPGETGARNARARGLANVVCSRLEDARFAPGSFSAAGAFDVIEHLAEPAGFLQTVRALLQEEGKLYLTVPAFPFLWSAEDEAAGHHRRYTLPSLRETLEIAGFTPEYATFIFRPLPFAVFFLRTVPSRLGLRRARSRWDDAMPRDHLAGAGAIRRLAEILLNREIRAIERRRAMAFGASILMVARA